MHQRPTRLRRFSDRDAGNDAAGIGSPAVAEDRRALDAGGEAVSRGKIYEVKAIRALPGRRVSKSVARVNGLIGQILIIGAPG
jgi:hypothetical protein